MPREIEVKFYDIEKDTVREKLKDIGLRRVHEEFLIRRRTFHPVKREKQEWFRVRQEHSRITLCYKCLHSREVDGLEEWETEVKDFDIASEIMIRSGLESTALQENLRETWCNDEIEIVIDTWPALKPYIEIEGASEEIVRFYTEKLGFDFSAGIFGGTEFLYEQELGIPTETLLHMPIITFEYPPKKGSE